MNFSEKTDVLLPALFKLQGMMPDFLKSADNPYFKSKYTPLDDMWPKVRELAQQCGLFALQPPKQAATPEGMVLLGVITRIVHAESGQWVETELLLPLDKLTPQAGGSLITYARRYSMAAILCIVADTDDDGEGSMNRSSKNGGGGGGGSKPKTAEEKEAARRTGTQPKATDTQADYDNRPIGAKAAGAYLGRWQKMGILEEEVAGVVAEKYAGASLNRLTNGQVQELDAILVRNLKDKEKESDA